FASSLLILPSLLVSKRSRKLATMRSISGLSADFLGGSLSAADAVAAKQPARIAAVKRFMIAPFSWLGRRGAISPNNQTRSVGGGSVWCTEFMPENAASGVKPRSRVFDLSYFPFFSFHQAFQAAVASARSARDASFFGPRSLPLRLFNAA